MARIIIIESSAGCRELAALICKLEGHSPVTVASGLEAWQRVRTEQFDLVLLGVFLPGIDGEDLLRRIRREPRCQRTPVVMLSSVVDRGTLNRLWRGGAADVVVKPYSGAGLRRSIAGALAHAA